jgi:hypothetical protein
MKWGSVPYYESSHQPDAMPNEGAAEYNLKYNNFIVLKTKNMKELLTSEM